MIDHKNGSTNEKFLGLQSSFSMPLKYYSLLQSETSLLSFSFFFLWVSVRLFLGFVSMFLPYYGRLASILYSLFSSQSELRYFSFGIGVIPLLFNSMVLLGFYLIVMARNFDYVSARPLLKVLIQTQSLFFEGSSIVVNWAIVADFESIEYDNLSLFFFASIICKIAFLGLLFVISLWSVSLYSEERKSIFGPQYPVYLIFRNAHEIFLALHLFHKGSGYMKVMSLIMILVGYLLISRTFTFYERRRSRLEIVIRLMEILIVSSGLTSSVSHQIQETVLAVVTMTILIGLLTSIGEFLTKVPTYVFSDDPALINQGFVKTLEISTYKKSLKTAHCSLLFNYQQRKKVSFFSAERYRSPMEVLQKVVESKQVLFSESEDLGMLYMTYLQRFDPQKLKGLKVSHTSKITKQILEILKSKSLLYNFNNTSVTTLKSMIDKFQLDVINLQVLGFDYWKALVGLETSVYLAVYLGRSLMTCYERFLSFFPLIRQEPKALEIFEEMRKKIEPSYEPSALDHQASAHMIGTEENLDELINRVFTPSSAVIVIKQVSDLFRIVASNTQASAFLGYSAREFVDMRPEILFPCLDCQFVGSETYKTIEKWVVLQNGFICSFIVIIKKEFWNRESYLLLNLTRKKVLTSTCTFLISLRGDILFKTSTCLSFFSFLGKMLKKFENINELLPGIWPAFLEHLDKGVMTAPSNMNHRLQEHFARLRRNLGIKVRSVKSYSEVFEISFLELIKERTSIFFTKINFTGEIKNTTRGLINSKVRALLKDSSALRHSETSESFSESSEEEDDFLFDSLQMIDKSNDKEISTSRVEPSSQERQLEKKHLSSNSEDSLKSSDPEDDFVSFKFKINFEQFQAARRVSIVRASTIERDIMLKCLRNGEIESYADGDEAEVKAIPTFSEVSKLETKCPSTNDASERKESVIVIDGWMYFWLGVVVLVFVFLCLGLWMIERTSSAVLDNTTKYCSFFLKRRNSLIIDQKALLLTELRLIQQFDLSYLMTQAQLVTEMMKFESEKALSQFTFLEEIYDLDDPYISQEFLQGYQIYMTKTDVSTLNFEDFLHLIASKLMNLAMIPGDYKITENDLTLVFFLKNIIGTYFNSEKEIKYFPHVKEVISKPFPMLMLSLTAGFILFILLSVSLFQIWIERRMVRRSEEMMKKLPSRSAQKAMEFLHSDIVDAPLPVAWKDYFSKQISNFKQRKIEELPKWIIFGPRSLIINLLVAVFTGLALLNIPWTSFYEGLELVSFTETTHNSLTFQNFYHNAIGQVLGTIIDSEGDKVDADKFENIRSEMLDYTAVFSASLADYTIEAENASFAATKEICQEVQELLPDQLDALSYCLKFDTNPDKDGFSRGGFFHSQLEIFDFLRDLNAKALEIKNSPEAEATLPEGETCKFPSALYCLLQSTKLQALLGFSVYVLWPLTVQKSISAIQQFDHETAHSRAQRTLSIFWASLGVASVFFSMILFPAARICYMKRSIDGLMGFTFRQLPPEKESHNSAAPEVDSTK